MPAANASQVRPLYDSAVGYDAFRGVGFGNQASIAPLVERMFSRALDIESRSLPVSWSGQVGTGIHYQQAGTRHLETTLILESRGQIIDQADVCGVEGCNAFLVAAQRKVVVPSWNIDGEPYQGTESTTTGFRFYPVVDQSSWGAVQKWWRSGEFQPLGEVSSVEGTEGIAVARRPVIEVDHYGSRIRVRVKRGRGYDSMEVDADQGLDVATHLNANNGREEIDQTLELIAAAEDQWSKDS